MQIIIIIIIYERLRNRVVTALRKAKTNYFMQLVNDSGGNSSYLWNHINTHLNRKSNHSGEIKELNVKKSDIHQHRGNG